MKIHLNLFKLRSTQIKLKHINYCQIVIEYRLRHTKSVIKLSLKLKLNQT